MWLVALLALSPLLPLAAGANPNADDPVTIYRCTDGDGRLSLRDTPCLPGERQQAREMLRPQDPAPRPADVAAPASAPLASSDPGPATPERMRIAPPPVYRCTTPDGAQYTSDSADGNPRWVPLWTLGYPVIVGPGHGYDRGPPVRPAGHRARPGSAQPARDGRPDFMFDSVGRPAPKPPRSQPGIPDRLPSGGVVQGPGSWIRDTCTRIPPAEVCQDLRDRHTALTRRYNSALQSERREIDAEKRRIDARLGSECPR